MGDPTRDEMLAHLYGEFQDELQANGEADFRFDVEEAIYWFANDWHGGQNSNLYSVLCVSPYRPGPCATGPERDDMYDSLEQRWGGV
jgi:hypothetical protein